MRKQLLTAAASMALLLAGLGIASSANAGTFIVTDVEMTNPSTVVLDGPAEGVNNEEVYLAQVTLTGTLNGKIVSLKAYCDDIENDIKLGSGQDLKFGIGQLTAANFSSATHVALDPTNPDEIGELGALAAQGRGTSDPLLEMSDQLVIWHMIYGDLTETSFLSALIPDIEPGNTVTNVAIANPLAKTFQLTSLDTPQQQMFIVAGGVPEPATWAAMLLGFGGIGAAMRAERRKRFAATA